MKVACSVITALAVLSFGVEARIGAQRKLQEDLELDVVGDGDIAPGSLGLCQGECDRDRDCAEGLVCFQRDANEPIPGCPDDGPGFDSRGDYCVKMEEDEDDQEEEEEEMPEPEDEPEPEPEEEEEEEEEAEEETMETDGPTEMDMETDGPTEDATVAPTDTEEEPEATVAPTDAEEEPEMTVAPTEVEEEPEATVAPTEEEVAMALEKPDEDDEMEESTTMDDDEPGTLNSGGNDGSPAEAFPLAVCQGDCDNDDECGEGLICLQRDPGEEVPGCVGNLDFSMDFCVLEKYGTTSGPEDSETVGPTEGATDGPEETFAPSE